MAVGRVIRSERRAPGRLALGIGNRRRVAEEVDVERLDRLRPDSRQLLAQDIRAEQGTGERAQSPALDTATASALPWSPAIGA